MWRSFLIMLDLDETKYSRSFDSFRIRAPSMVIQYDASLSGMAVCMSSIDGEGCISLVRFAAIKSPYPVTTDSSFQNVYEYIAVLMGLLLAKNAGLYGFAYNLIGDSISSLSWVEHDRVKSQLAIRAGIGFTTVSVDIDSHVGALGYVPSHFNSVLDDLSRGKTPEEAGVPPSLQVQLSEIHPIMVYLRLCDPSIPMLCMDDTLDLLTGLRHSLASML
jgi:hypothetical protein